MASGRKRKLLSISMILVHSSRGTRKATRSKYQAPRASTSDCNLARGFLVVQPRNLACKSTGAHPFYNLSDDLCLDKSQELSHP